MIVLSNKSWDKRYIKSNINVMKDITHGKNMKMCGCQLTQLSVFNLFKVLSLKIGKHLDEIITV